MQVGDVDVIGWLATCWLANEPELSRREGMGRGQPYGYRVIAGDDVVPTCQHNASN
jgi:hypothetical protein